MASLVVSFRSLKSLLNDAISKIADPRAPSNATSYSMRDTLLGAFGCFFMQSESFLDYQRQLNSRHGKDNAQNLFGLEQIPSVEQIRNNFGDGQANLSSILLSLNLLAFLFHTVLEWSDRRYQQMRQRRDTRTGFD
ncbi:MAG: hypothetical protein AAFR42_06215 [Cyanobacteria bacterium J06628_6]